MDRPLPANLPELLAQRLRAPLPGSRVQAAWQPELSYGRHFGPPAATARPAAVLLLLYPDSPGWCLPLTLRPPHLTDHAGQISFPGGGVDPHERSEQAGLRELQEELGVGAAGIEMLGELSPIYLYRTNYLIQPWLAWAATRPDWHPNSAEVAALLEIPLAELADRSAARTISQHQSGVEFRAPAFVWREQAIWGATAMILAELVHLATAAS